MNYDIFSRTRLIIGQNGLNKLNSSAVAVFGLGGVGSFAAEALARTGVGNLIIVDFDTVDISNINRQLHALTSTVGQPKTLLMEHRLKDIKPGIKVQAHHTRFCPEKAPEIFDDKNVDFVVDAIDDVPNKLMLIIECTKRNIPIISAMGAGNKLNPTLFQVDSIWNTRVCPLARVMRKKLREAGIEKDVPVVFSTETPRELSRKSCEKQVPGSVAFVPPVAGLIISAYVVDKLLSLDIFPDK